MNAQDEVLECFPDCEARKEASVFQEGTGYPIVREWWVVYTGPGLDADELGRGRSEFEAWSDAAGLLGNQAA